MSRGRSQRTLDLIAAAYEILSDIKPATVRAVCYKLFTAGLISSMAKTETNKVSRLLTLAREADEIPWEWVVDETREAERISAWDDPQDYARAVINSYRRHYWSQQPAPVETWSEKGTVRGTLAPVFDQYGVTFRVMHGYSSSTAIRQIAEETATQPRIAFYIGDWDPSGLHMSEVDLPQRLAAYGAKITLIRIALTQADANSGFASLCRPNQARRHPVSMVRAAIWAALLRTRRARPERAARARRALHSKPYRFRCLEPLQGRRAGRAPISDRGNANLARAGGDAMTAPLRLTLFKNLVASVQIPMSLTTEQITSMLVMPSARVKNGLPLLSLQGFGNLPTAKNCLRWDGNVVESWGVAGDYDGEELDYPEAIERLNRAQLEAIVYTSPSYTPEKPRWRVLCWFSQGLEPAQMPRMMDRLNGALGGVLKGESWALSQGFFYGRVVGGHEVVIEASEGEPLDLRDELDEIAIGKPNGGNGHPKTSGSPEADIGDIVAALDVIPNPLPSWDPKNGTWVEWNNIGMAIWRASAGSAEGFAAFDKWSTKWSAKYDPRNPSSAGTIFSGPRPTTSRSAPWCTSRARRSRDGYRRAEVNRTYPKFASTPDAARGWSTSSRTRS